MEIAKLGTSCRTLDTHRGHTQSFNLSSNESKTHNILQNLHTAVQKDRNLHSSCDNAILALYSIVLLIENLENEHHQN